MSLSKQFATDTAKEEQGVPVTYGENEDKSVPTFIVSRMSKSNKSYQKALTSAMRPHQRAQQLGTLPPEMAEQIFLEVFAKHILRGWSNVLKSDVTGVESDKGFAEYSAHNAIALMKRLPDLYDNIVETANSAALFREGMLEEEAGN